MAQFSSVLQPDTNHAHPVALGVLCALGGLCVAAAVYGFSGRSGTGARSQATNLAQEEAALLSSVAPRTAPPVALPLSSPFPPIPAPTYPTAPMPVATAPPVSLPPTPARTFAPAAPPATPAPVASAVPTPQLPPGKQLKNPQAMEGVMAARTLREQGDMQGAIEALKSSDLREPNHPEILGEMALTYEEMGISSRSEPLWRQIYTMGEANAGDYFTMASSKIGTQPSAAGAEDTPTAPAAPVTLGACRLSREPLATAGERITLRVPILASPGATIDPTKIEIHVTLFESVNNGERVDAVPQEKTTQSWSTMPLNWSEAGGEAVDVTTDLFARRQGAEGTRTFHGHSVKLFYHDKLVGEQAQPESLRDGAPKRPAPAGLDNALFPK